MFGAEPMTVPHSGIQYAQPSSWKEPGGIFRLAASACVVMPIAAQTAAVIAIIRALSCCPPVVLGPASGGSLIKQKCCAAKKSHRLSRVYVLSCPLWVKSGHRQCKKACPLYPRKRTCAVQLGMSALGQ